MTYESMLAETVAFRGHEGDVGEAYHARPLGGGPLAGVVLIHHMPGWDEWIKETTRKLAHHGYATISPHLYFREGPGSPEDIGARTRAKASSRVPPAAPTAAMGCAAAGQRSLPYATRPSRDRSPEGLAPLGDDLAHQLRIGVEPDVGRAAVPDFDGPSGQRRA